MSENPLTKLSQLFNNKKTSAMREKKTAKGRKINFMEIQSNCFMYSSKIFFSILHHHKKLENIKYSIRKYAKTGSFLNFDTHVITFFYFVDPCSKLIF